MVIVRIQRQLVDVVGVVQVDGMRPTQVLIEADGDTRHPNEAGSADVDFPRDGEVHFMKDLGPAPRQMGVPEKNSLPGDRAPFSQRPHVGTAEETIVRIPGG